MLLKEEGEQFVTERNLQISEEGMPLRRMVQIHVNLPDDVILHWYEQNEW